MIDAQVKLAKAKQIECQIIKLQTEIHEINKSIPDYFFGTEDHRSLSCAGSKFHNACDSPNCNCICHGAKDCNVKTIS